MTVISASTLSFSSITIKNGQGNGSGDSSFLDMLNKKQTQASASNNILGAGISLSTPSLAYLDGNTSNALTALTASNSKSPADSFNELLSGLTNISTQTKTDNTASTSSDQLLKFIQQVLANMDDSLGNIISPSTSVDKASNSGSAIDALNSSDSTNAVDAFSATDPEFLTGNGPLPAFMHALDVKLHLSPTQQLALRQIAEENKAIVKTPDSVKKLGEELAQAGIGNNTVSV